ncbi:MAG TPA: hypothetical protein VF859_10760 [Burkholderiales bacterium]
MKNAKDGAFQFLSGSLLVLVASYAGTLTASAADQVLACPASVVVSGIYTGQPPAGWTGSGEGGPYGFKQAMLVNQNQLACVYVQKLSTAGLSRPWEAGTTCTFAGDKKTWNCKDSAGATKSYACPPSMMISAKATSKLPDGWQGSGESGPFPFLNAPAPDTNNRVLRCIYQVPAFTYSLTRIKPAGLCSFDNAKMSWVCKSVSAVREVPVKPATGIKQIPGQ